MNINSENAIVMSPITSKQIRRIMVYINENKLDYYLDKGDIIAEYLNNDLVRLCHKLDVKYQIIHII